MSKKKQTAMHQFLSELHLRLAILNSEPDGVVRETMIQNFLIDGDLYLKLEKQQIIDAINYGQNNHSVSIESDKIKAEKYSKETYEQ